MRPGDDVVHKGGQLGCRPVAWGMPPLEQGCSGEPFAHGLLQHQCSPAASPFLALCLSFPLAPEPPSWRGGFSHAVCPRAAGHGVSVSAGAAFPGLLPLSLKPWHGKAAAGKGFMALWQLPEQQSGVGHVGLSPRRRRCCSMGTPWLSAPCHHGTAPRGAGGLGGRAVAGAWRARVPPSPAWRVTHSPSGSSHAAAFPRDRGDASKPQRWNESPSPCPRGLGRVCTLSPAKESREAAGWGAGPPHLGWQTGQPALEWKAAKSGLAQHWQRLEGL